MKLDLAASSKTQVTLDCELSSAQSNKVPISVWKTIFRDTAYTGFYQLDGRLYFVQLLVHANKGRKQSLHVRLQYQLLPKSARAPTAVLRRGQREFERLEQHAQKLAGAELRGTCKCHIDWEFSRGTFETVVHLPLLSFAKGSMPFDEITGVRLTKSQEGKPMTVVLELAGSKGLQAHAYFSQESLFTADLVTQVGAHGEDILKSFVVRKEAGQAL